MHVTVFVCKIDDDDGLSEQILEKSGNRDSCSAVSQDGGATIDGRENVARFLHLGVIGAQRDSVVGIAHLDRMIYICGELRRNSLRKDLHHLLRILSRRKTEIDFCHGLRRYRIAIAITGVS